MKNKRKINFRKFINDCYVEYEGFERYHVISSKDDEVSVTVNASNWEIETNDSNIDIDNDAKRELLFSKIDDYIEDNKPANEDDYEHPSVAGGLYGNTITGIYKYKN